MSHQMEPWLDARRDERDRLWARRDALEERLKPMPLSAFTFGQFADLRLLADRSAVSERSSDLVKALERLEAAFPAPQSKPAKKKLRASRRRQ